MISNQSLLTLIPLAFEKSKLPLPGMAQGKVRDWYDLPDGKRLLVTTDRLSAFSARARAQGTERSVADADAVGFRAPAIGASHRAQGLGQSGGEGIHVHDVYLHRGQTVALGQPIDPADDSRHLVTPVKRLVQDLRPNEPGRADERHFHIASPFSD